MCYFYYNFLFMIKNIYYLNIMWIYFLFKYFVIIDMSREDTSKNHERKMRRGFPTCPFLFR